MRLWQRVLGGAGRKALTLPVNGLGLGWSSWSDEEPPPHDFESYALQFFAANPIVYAAESVRKAVFSQGRFQWRSTIDGRVFGNQDLRILERPWPGGWTGKLLSRTLLHADIGGNAYILRADADRLSLMRPDRVTIVMGSRIEPEAPGFAEDVELVAYMYTPSGAHISGAGAATGGSRLYLPSQVAHFAPMPDPTAHFRGMSWLTPVIREIQGDAGMVTHKNRYLTNAATPNLVIKFDTTQTVAQVKAFRDLMEADHSGIDNAYKTLYLGGGADATVVGSDFKQLDFAAVSGKSETRILMAAGVHPVIAGASEGLSGASLNAGNFQQVRRLFADIHLQDLWNQAAGAFQAILSPPAATQLVIDGRQVPFLQDDQIDLAEIQRSQARTIDQLIRAGFTPESAVAAVTSDDMTLLIHTGLVSVQLQPPLADGDDSPQEGDDGQ